MKPNESGEKREKTGELLWVALKNVPTSYYIKLYSEIRSKIILHKQHIVKFFLLRTGADA